MNIKAKLLLLLFSLNSAFAQTPKIGEVKVFNGRPTIFINDKPESPIFYSPTHAYGGRWSWEEVPQRNIKNFCEVGVKLFQLDLYFEDIWYKGVDTLDIAKAQKQVRGALEVCENASVVIRVHTNAPFWWNEANKDECTEYADGPMQDRPYGAPFNNEDGDPDRSLRASLASMKWRREAGEKLIEFCTKLSKTKEGGSVVGIHVCGGVYGEWHYWGFPSHSADVGKAMTTYFRDWLKRKYQTDKNLQTAWKTTKYTLQTATVPDTSERINSKFGILRTPEQEQRTIDYFTAQQEVVAEDIEYFCKIVKDTWPRKVMVGVFYGYFFMTFSRQASGGHLLVERILNCPYIDYFAAPQSYWGGSMNLGGPGHSRGVIESATLRGKLWLDEVDNGHLQKQAEKDVVRQVYNIDPEYIPVIRRSALNPLVRGGGLWYYDFGLRKSFGWWDNPTYLKNIKQEVDFFKNRVNVPYKSEADVLVVWDQESFYYVQDRWTPLSFDFIDQETVDLYKSGASMDHIYVFDLPKVNLKQYKAVVMMNVWKLTVTQKDFIFKNVYKDGRTIFWHYLPGVTDGKKMSLDLVKPLVKINFSEFKTQVSKPKVFVKTATDTITYGLDKHLEPAIEIIDKSATVISVFKADNRVCAAKKQFSDHTIIYSTVALHEPKVFRQLFKEAGCHIWNEKDDVTVAGSGLVWIHTVDGGKRTLKLRNGKSVEIELPRLSTTLYSIETGEKIF